MRIWGKVVMACCVAAAVVVGCKTSTAGGNASGEGSADGGMMSGAQNAAHAAGQWAADAGAQAMDAAHSAGQAVADAGAQAYGAARDAASAGATTAADAARGAMGGDGGMSMDGGMSGMSGMSMDGGMSGMSGGMSSGQSSGSMSGSMDGGASGSSASSGSYGSSSGSSGSGGSMAAPTSDAQIVAIVHAANQGEIEEARLAKTNSKNAKVKAFAAMMVKDHTAMEAQGKKLGVTPEDTDTSRALTQQAQDDVSKLQSLKGKDFDSAYVDAQVQAHTKVLQILDAAAPVAQDAKLKAMLKAGRTKVQHHLDQAQALQSSMSK